MDNYFPKGTILTCILPLEYTEYSEYKQFLFTIYSEIYVC
jgi:hypothetical protein